MDKSRNSRYKNCKYIVKKWENEFKRKNNSPPAKDDIKCAPKKIKDAYKIYWSLKHQASKENSNSNIHIDENAKDCFNSSSEMAEEGHNNNKDNIINNISNLEDSVCFKALSDTTASNLSLYSNEKNDSKLLLDNSASFDVQNIEKPVEERNCYNNANEFMPSNFENLFNKENKSLLGNQSLSNVNDSNLIKQETENNIKKFEVKSISHQYAEKLFAGSKFNKRNPRKPRSFNKKKSGEVIKEKHETVLELSQHNSNCKDKFSPDIKINSFSPSYSNLSSLLPPILLNEKTQEECTKIYFNDKFKIVYQNSTVLPSQPVSLLQKSLDKSFNLKLPVSRTVDRGWLERVNESNTFDDKKFENNRAESQDSGFSSLKADSLFDSITNPETSGAKCSNVESDDDVIYDSDCESQNNCRFRLNLSEKLFNIPKGVRQQQNNSAFSNHSLVGHSEKLGKTAKNIFCNDKMKEFSQNNSIINGKRRYNSNDTDSTPLLKKFKSDSENIFCSTTKPELIVAVKQKNETVIEDTNDSDAKREILAKKLASGEANKNFVKINIEKKRYVRGKKNNTFSKYKKQKWKQMKKSNNFTATTGIIKCYKCGDIGHFSKACPKKVDCLLPIEEYDSADESPFPSLEEAAEMATQAAESAHKTGRKFTISDKVELPENIIIADDSCQSLDIKPLFKLTSDGSVIETPKEVYTALKELGHKEFRFGQENGIMRILSGLSTIVTLSTGSGKSLIYQLPAYMYNKAYPGCITLVISPLVSLMEDQIFCGSKKLRAACLHHNMTAKKRESVMEALKNQSISILLIAPESLSSWDSAKSLFKILPPIAFACIDEAHSISQHSHNFRPSYLTVCQVLREKMGISTFLGLTATASVISLETITDQLAINDASSSLISDIPVPNNLNLSVSSDDNKEEALLMLLKSKRFEQCDSIIIYCTRREECDKVAAFLRASLQESRTSNTKSRISFHAEAYHAGLTAGRRNQIQTSFMSGKLRIVIATIAFGMGVNKQDIRGIIHYTMPHSIESYVQEIGRAGRDKEPAECHLFLDSKKDDLSELRRHIYADTVDRHTLRKLLQLIFLPCNCDKKSLNKNTDDACEDQKDVTVICQKHEIAFPVENTVMSLDMPQEAVSTLLAYLQLDEEKWIKILPLAYTNCKVTSYRGVKHLKKVARNCAPLAVSIAEEGDSFNQASIEFDVIKLARKINWDSGTVKHCLKQLEFITGEDNKPHKSGILVEFTYLGFRALAPGNLTDVQLDKALDMLYSNVKNLEDMKIKQLNLFYDLLKRVGHKNVKMCCDTIDQEKCQELKIAIRKYFSNTDPLSGINIIVEKVENEIDVIGDIRRLISTYRDEKNFTGRNIARIFHGIGSPNYPPIFWGRTRYWRLHLNKDFNSLVALANKQLILMR